MHPQSARQKIQRAFMCSSPGDGSMQDSSIKPMGADVMATYERLGIQRGQSHAIRTSSACAACSSSPPGWVFSGAAAAHSAAAAYLSNNANYIVENPSSAPAACYYGPRKPGKVDPSVPIESRKLHGGKPKFSTSGMLLWESGSVSESLNVRTGARRVVRDSIERR